MIIAIDVGYSHVKAISHSGQQRVLIPSVVSPARELALADLFSNSAGHIVEIRKVDGTANKYFVGELALREGQAAGFTMDREKHKHKNHDILLFTATRLLNIESGATLIAGLPVAYYRLQKDELARHLMGIHAEVSVNNSKLRRISFGKVIIYPQGAGALLTADTLPGSGLIVLVDVGFKTTDFVTAEVTNGIARPVSSLCGSIEVGVYQIHEAVSAEFEAQTGMPLADVRVPEAVSQGKAYFYGREIGLTGIIEKAKADIAQNIYDQVMARLGDRAAFVRRFFIAGGGAEALPMLASLFPVAKILPDPQWANTLGFLKVVEQLRKQEY